MPRPMPLRLLLDSANPREWERWLARGLFHGVTTNPTLLRRAGQPCEAAALAKLTERALALGAQEVHLQAWGVEAAGLITCGRQLAEAAGGRVVVKLPVTGNGSEAARTLIAEGIPITLTACYEAHQVLIAAALGVRYIAPYLGRICDQGRDGHGELITMQRCLDGLGSNVRLLVASLRTPADLVRLAAAGMSTFTLSPALAEDLMLCQATQEAVVQFERDAAGL
jgi:transaldolase